MNFCYYQALNGYSVAVLKKCFLSRTECMSCETAIDSEF